MLWIDGHSIGDNEWLTYGYRDQDMNKDVTLIEDYSLKYQWKKESGKSSGKYGPNGDHTFANATVRMIPSEYVQT